jgi:hypothetical protein
MLKKWVNEGNGASPIPTVEIHMSAVSVTPAIAYNSEKIEKAFLIDREEKHI